MRIVSILVPYLIGAAITLVVQAVIQLYVVPRVETRKRRQDRFERNVLDLGELLTTLVGERAQAAQVEQSVYRALVQRQRENDPSIDQARLAQGLPERAATARAVTREFTGLVRERVVWLTERVTAFMPDANEIGMLLLRSLHYRNRVLAVGDWRAEDDTADEAFEEVWEKEWTPWQEFISQVKLVVNLPHPPRPPRFRLLIRGWRRARKAVRS